MDCKGEFQGKIIINGELAADSVAVFIAEDSLLLRKGGDWMLARKQLAIMPFSKHMLFTQDVRRLAEGYFYDISGTRVGGFTYGPLGHPADGEFDYRPIKSIRLDVKYYSDQVTAVLTGKTESGLSAFGNKEVLEPWVFFIEFDIPRAEMQQFFELSDATRDRLIALMEAHCPPCVPVSET
jgi:hypothetical protein